MFSSPSLAAQYTNPKLICLKFHVENESLENAGVMMASDLPAARRNLAHFMIIAAQCTAWTVNDVFVDPHPFLFWSIHTILMQ